MPRAQSIFSYVDVIASEAKQSPRGDLEMGLITFRRNKMIRARILATSIVIAAAIQACAPTSALPPQDQAATIVAGTMQALTPQLPAAANTEAPEATQTSAPLPTPAPAGLLPHSLYFLNNDSGGLLQVFRMERDGSTTRQVTSEPVAVDAFDVSPKDGSVAYSSNNQLLLVGADGAGRRTVLDGGPLDDNNRWNNSVGTAVWSPDGQTLAFGHGGLNFLTLSSGAITTVLQNQVDTSSGTPMVQELYAPSAYSPDGSRLLINIGLYEGGSYGIFAPSNNALIRLTRSDGTHVCCYMNWQPDGSGLYVTSPLLGLVESGLFHADAGSGNVTTLLPGSAADGTYNFADAAQLGADGKLYFFFNNLPTFPTSGHTPLFLVRSDPDGVTDRTQLQADAIQNVNEVLWAADASLAIVVSAPSADVYAGGQAQVIYPDGRPSVTLMPSAQALRWGP
jgi:Tol biopolymer transport system component